MTSYTPMMEEQEATKSLKDYVSLLKRRRLALTLPALAVFAVALMVAFSLPATYQSKATILIEQQEIPQDLVRSTITSFAAQQVQVISQRVLTVENITGIVEKFKLYQRPSSQSRIPSTELARLFRDSMALDLVSADVIDPRSGSAKKATIAFTLAFEDSQAANAQKVTSELVTLFLNENLRNRTNQAASTAEFLNREASRLNDELVNLEQRLADFKAGNEGSLPELYQFNLATLERTQSEISDAKYRLQELESRKLQLAAELALLSPSAPVMSPGGQMVLSDHDRLKALQSNYRAKAAIYRDNHPDLVRLQREIAALQAQLGVEADVEDLKQQLQQQQSHLAELNSKYTANHHEVVSTQRQVEQLNASISRAQAADSNNVDVAGTNAPVADNPAYVLLATQLSGIEFEMNSLHGKRAELQQKITRYENLLKQAPHVEKDYQALLRNYSNATAKYQETNAKLRLAAVAKDLEQEQKGERFTLIEPPALPLNPISPNRPAIVFLGLVLAAGCGLGFAMLREAMHPGIHGVNELSAVMGQAPLVVIPYIENSEDLQRGKRFIKVSLATITVLGVLFVVYLHFFFKPLDVLWFVILNKLGFG